jgi:hypothetical protein
VIRRVFLEVENKLCKYDLNELLFRNAKNPNQTRSQGRVQVCARHPLQVTRNLQNIEDKHADQPVKTRVTLPHPRVASVEQPCLEKHYFKKCLYMQDVLCNVVERIA